MQSNSHNHLSWNFASEGIFIAHYLASLAYMVHQEEGLKVTNLYLEESSKATETDLKQNFPKGDDAKIIQL
jgi:hypothetical protein